MNNKLEQLYEILIRGFALTKEILNMYNFTEEDINELVKENVLKEIEINKWDITNVDSIYKYGIKLHHNKKFKKAETCFRICYQKEPTNRKFCLQLLLIELKKENYIAVQKMFALLEKIEPNKYYEDNNLYLYLLSIILYNNQDYQMKVKK